MEDAEIQGIVIPKYPHECIDEAYGGIGVAHMENGSGGIWTCLSQKIMPQENTRWVSRGKEKHRCLAGRKMRCLTGCLRLSIIVQQRSG